MTARERGAAPGSRGRRARRGVCRSRSSGPHRDARGVVLGGTVGVAPAAAATDDLRLAVAVDLSGRPGQARGPRGDGHHRDEPEARHGHDGLLLRLDHVRRAARGDCHPGDVRTARSSTVTTAKRDEFRRVTIHYPEPVPRQDADDPPDLRAAERQAPLRQPDPRREGVRRRSTAWAWGDPGRGDVRIVMPPGFTADITDRPDRRGRPADGDHRRRSHRIRRQGPRRPDRLVQHRRGHEPRRPDRRPDHGAGRADRHPCLARGPDWVDRVSTILEDEPARPRGCDRPAVAGHARPRGDRGRRVRDRGLRRASSTRPSTGSRSARTSTT